MSAFVHRADTSRFRGNIIEMVTSTWEAPDGTLIERDVVRHPGAVAVVPVLADGRVVLVRQFRAPLGTEVLELPAGIRDVDGEPPADTAARELREETGYLAGRVEHLADMPTATGFCDEVISVFLATDLTASQREAHGPEEQHMAVVPVEPDDVLGGGTGDVAVDAKTLAGVALALRRLADPGG